jgi:hypothetical protein
MALTDPQSITVSAATSSLPRTSVEGDKSEYTSSDGLIKLTADHTPAKQGRVRRLLRIDHSKLTSDPYKPSDNVKVGMAIYIVFDIPPAGYSATEQLAVYTGFKTMFSASSDALITKVLGGES